jgi:hypothetical protein
MGKDGKSLITEDGTFSVGAEGLGTVFDASETSC